MYLASPWTVIACVVAGDSHESPSRWAPVVTSHFRQERFHQSPDSLGESPSMRVPNPCVHDYYNRARGGVQLTWRM